MAKLILSALIGVLVLGFTSGMTTARAAPPVGNCTGVDSVWLDIDRTQVIVNAGGGNDQISWRARGHTTLDCGAGSPLTRQVAQIEQRVSMVISGPRGDLTLRGHAQTSLSYTSGHATMGGAVQGMGSCNAGTCNVSFVLDSTNGGVRRLKMSQHGTFDLGTKQWTALYIDDIVIGFTPPFPA